MTNFTHRLPKNLLSLILLTSFLLSESGESLKAQELVKDKECINCFDTEIISIDRQDGCIDYTLEVNANNCKYALSHFTVAIECGTISNASNSRNYPMELNTTDPTTGLKGIKVDEIQNFGEDGASDTFTLSFSVCSSDDQCLDLLDQQDLQVAYKASNCVFTDTIEVAHVELEATIEATHIACAGEANGTLDLSVSKGLAPYTYLWNTGAKTEDLTNVPAGTYSVIITDANHQTLELQTTINQPQALTITGTTTPANCGNNDGSINISVSGGEEPYSYLWNNDSTTQNISNLADGYYLIVVTDNLGCRKSMGFRVSEITSLNLSIPFQTLPCEDDGTGELTVNVTDGEAPLSYLWSNGDTTQTVTNLTGGSYKVTVTDNKGCSAQKTGYVVIQKLSASTSITPTSCYDGSDGKVSLSIQNGTPPYQIKWSTGETGTSIEGLTSGWHWATISDAKGCSSNKNFFIPQPEALTLSHQIKRASCEAGDSTIIIDLAGNNGVAPYSIYHEGILIEKDFSTEKTGSYTFSVTDALGCTHTESIEVTRPESEINVTTNINQPSCSDINGGKATIITNGGTEPYAIIWPDGSNMATRDNLEPGIYNVTISDASNCTNKVTVEINEVKLPQIKIETPAELPNCNSTGNILIATTENIADSNWEIQSTSNDWIIETQQLNQLVYTSGNEGASFILSGSSSDGCSVSDTISLACISNDTEENPDDSDDSQPDNDSGSKDCGTNPYNIITSAIIQDEGGCYSYYLTVTTDGSGPHELSHMVIGISDEWVSEADNSENWKMELNMTDPTTGLYGFKVDDIEGFGHQPNGRFDVSFTLCNQSNTVAQDFTVAYKSGQCIYTDTIHFESPTNEGLRLKNYPNPYTTETYFEVVTLSDTNIDLAIFDTLGNKVEQLCQGPIEKGVHTFIFSNNSGDERFYFYRLTNNQTSKQGKLLQIK